MILWYCKKEISGKILLQIGGYIMNNYEINENTLAVVSVNEKESMIIEKNKCVVVNDVTPKK